MGVTMLDSVDTKTPWCSQCLGYTDYSAEISYASEGGAVTTRRCKCCNDIMWSVDSCKMFVRIWKFFSLFMCGMSIFFAVFTIVVIEDAVMRVALACVGPIVTVPFLLVLYWCSPWRRKTKHLKRFEAWATQQARNLYSERK